MDERAFWEIYDATRIMHLRVETPEDPTPDDLDDWDGVDYMRNSPNLDDYEQTYPSWMEAPYPDIPETCAILDEQYQPYDIFN